MLVCSNEDFCSSSLKGKEEGRDNPENPREHLVTDGELEGAPLKGIPRLEVGVLQPTE